MKKYYMKITNKGDVIYIGDKMKLYVMRDSKAETYGQNIMLFKNNGEAIRSVQQAMETGDNLLAKYPEDFALFCLGNYEQDSGTITLLPQKQHITDIIEIVKK